MGRKILLADDSRNIIDLLKYNFEKKGYDVIEASNGEQALEKAFRESPDMIILDINMPLKDGFEVCRTLRNTPQSFNVPIIILSARGEEFDKLTGFGAGADDYIVKPFKVEELIESADSLLNGKNIRRPGRGKGIEAGKGIGKAPVSLGDDKIDALFEGKLYIGANILLTGPLGAGKSTVCRKFIASGLRQEESCLYMSAEDPPEMIRESLNGMVGGLLRKYEEDRMFRIVSIPEMKAGDYDEMLGKISAAGEEIEQSIQRKKGGRRAVDSVSGLIMQYGEAKIYQFLSHIVHTASAFGGVTTIYTLEEGTVTAQQAATVKSLMDGVIEFREEPAGIYARVLNMKWIDFSGEKVKLWNKA